MKKLEFIIMKVYFKVEPSGERYYGKKFINNYILVISDINLKFLIKNEANLRHCNAYSKTHFDNWSNYFHYLALYECEK